MEKKEYIKRGVVLKILGRYSLKNTSALGRHSGAVEAAMNEVESLPAADVVEVVRCIECRYRQDRLYCRRLKEHPFIVTNTDFCSCGERKEE